MNHINVQGFSFDLTQPIYLSTAGNKFWEATLEGRTMKVRVGKKKDATTVVGQEKMEKTYGTVELAKASIAEKIKEKLIKGYVSANSIFIKSQQNKELKREEEKKKPTNKKTRKDYSGEYLEKGGEAIKFQISQKKVRITRIGSDKQQKIEVRTFPSHQDSVDYCLSQQQWLLSNGYKINKDKFTYTFIEQQQTEIKHRPIRKNPVSTSNNNFLSITGMTDDAISRSSRQHQNLSPTKSNRSAYDDDQETQFKSTALGPSTTACIKVLLAETWDDTNDPTGWYMSEKLDGVRCFWTGTQMFSRNGNRFFPPKFFTKNWPKSQLDGQLFIGRNKFSQTISAIKKGTPIDSEWEKVCYLVFDAPGLKTKFSERVKVMQQTITKINSPYLKCHAHRVCNGFTDMFNQLEEVNKIKGEGLMLRDPNSFYQNRRSKSLLKVKTFYDDEATILGYKDGTGRCQGMVGALRVRNTHGTQFEVGSGLNDDMRRRPPKIGTMITYKYQEFNASGKPRFPTFLRIYQPL